MKNLKLYVITILLLTQIFNSFGQQDPMFTQYMFNTLGVNPAYAGSYGALNMTGIARSQWLGIEGAPKTQSFIMHTPFVSENVGVGLSFINDKIGPTTQTMIYGDYSYTIRVSEKAKLAFGLKGGVDMISNKLTSVSTTQQNDQSFSTNVNYKPMPNFGFGLYYHSDKWYIGLSTPKIIENKVAATGGSSIVTEQRHYFIITGIVFNLTNNIKFKPSTLVKATFGAPVSIDLNANFLFKEKLWLGVGYRYGDSFSAMTQLQLNNQFRVGYSYDYTLSHLTTYNSGSHEIILSYTFSFKKDKVLSPRYF